MTENYNPRAAILRIAAARRAMPPADGEGRTIGPTPKFHYDDKGHLIGIDAADPNEPGELPEQQQQRRRRAQR